MGWIDRLAWWMSAPEYQPVAARPAYPVQAYSVIDLANDVGFPDFMRGGQNIAGAALNRRSVMRNTAVKRSVNLISNVIGFLPLPILQKDAEGSAKDASDHPLYPLFSKAANTRQDAFQFRRLIQRWALIDGNGYAEILRIRGRVTGLLPIHPSKVRQRDNWNDPYTVTGTNGSGTRTIQPEDMFHLMGDSDDGLNGLSLIDEAADALGLALQADKAAARLFKHGALIRDVLESDKKLSPEALANLKASLSDSYGGADNAAKTIVTEEGLKYRSVQANAKESQHLETRDHQVEEVARIFGMPRPFLMMDDTSWGSGIEQLGIYFTTYTLDPWLKAWESAIARSLLTNEDHRQGIYAKFNERALLRGSMADQAEFLSKLMGSGGSPQIAEQNEARGYLDLPPHPDGYGLNSGAVNGGADNGATE